MNIDSIFEIFDEPQTKRHSLTRRESHLIEFISAKIENHLFNILKQDSRETRLNFSSIDNKLSVNSICSGVELTLTLFHRTCQVFLTSVVALEIVNRYLEKALPAVDRALNSEELSVLALVVTLTISELREEGILGIYLRDLTNFDNELEITAEDLILEETNCKQLLIIRMEAVTFEQIRERAKLVLLENCVEKKVLNTSFVSNLEIDAEVRSFATLLSIKPGLKWNLGREVPIAITLNDELVGYGELQIQEEK